MTAPDPLAQGSPSPAATEGALTIAVLMGGWTRERDISLKTGAAVAEALRAKGHVVREVDTTNVLAELAGEPIASADVVFVALHGGPGEDGRVQSALELAGKSYVGCGPTACAVTMDKALAKHVFVSLGVPTPAWRLLRGDESVEELLDRASEFGQPLVLKPVDEGSAIDVLVEPDEAGIRELWGNPGRSPGRWLLERYIPGRELTLPILWGEPTPVVEISPKEGFYDYQNKYTVGCTEYDCPAEIAPPVSAQMAEYGRRIWSAFGLVDMARLDFRLDTDGRPWCLEVNTIPGMTSISLFPMGVKEQGMDFETLCDQLCRKAFERGSRATGGRN